jgi:predicted nucleic acid-binding Zn ribbon protein
LNPLAVEAYNEQRRREYREAHPLPTRACVVCGQPFSKRPDALVCSDVCRNLQKGEERRQREKATA